MPYDVSGNFTRSYNWVNDKNAAVKITASRMDGEFNNFATGMNQVLLRNGVAAMSGVLNMGANGISALADGSAGTPALRFNASVSTGLYSSGLNKVALAAAGGLVLEASSTGVAVTGTLGASGNVSGAAAAFTGALSAASASFTAPLPYGSGGTGTNGLPANGEILIGNGGGYSKATISPGTGISVTNGAGTITIANTTNGTVTSLNVSGGTTGLTFSGGPITTNGTITMTGTLGLTNGGVGATTQAGARTTLGAAASGANSDITSLSALSTPLSITQGGTGGGSQSAARTGLGLGTISTYDEATAANYRANTASKALSPAAVWSAAAIVPLTDAATIAVDMSTFINAEVTLGGNRTLGAPTNPKVGQSGFIRLIQDATGGRTLSITGANNWKTAGGVAPTLSTAANAIDVLKYIVHSSTFIEYSIAKDVK